MNIRIVGILILSSTCSWAGAPEWVSQTGRQVIAGDIVHWGTGDAATPDVALFKARQMAIKTLIEECGGVANKEIIPRKQYVESEGDTYRAYSLVSLDFESCQAAKSRDGKKLENPEIVEAQKLYRKLVFAEQQSSDTSILVEIEHSIRDDMRNTESEHKAEIQRLSDDISSLKEGMASQVQPVTIQVQTAKLPATSSMKLYCQSQYQAMMNTLSARSIPYNGNMAAPELGGELGAAQQQRALCERME